MFWSEVGLECDSTCDMNKEEEDDIVVLKIEDSVECETVPDSLKEEEDVDDCFGLKLY